MHKLSTMHDVRGSFNTVVHDVCTASAEGLAQATRAVLALFLDSDADAPLRESQAAYLELRTTPRASAPHMTRRQYLETVLDELERYPASRAALIVSVDRRMDATVAEEVVALAVQLCQEGRRVVGVDLCGDPLVSAASGSKGVRATE